MCALQIKWTQKPITIGSKTKYSRTLVGIKMFAKEKSIFII